MVTWHQLACIAGIIVSLGAIAFGALATFGDMMADTGGRGGAAGCAPLLGGLVLLGVSIWGLS